MTASNCNQQKTCYLKIFYPRTDAKTLPQSKLATAAIAAANPVHKTATNPDGRTKTTY